MSQEQRVKEILNQAAKIRASTKTSCIQLENYLLYQHLAITSNRFSLPCSKPDAQMDKYFSRAYKTLTKTEKAELYLLNVKNAHRLVRRKERMSVSSPSRKMVRPATRKMYISFKDGELYKKWKNIEIQVLREHRSLKIIQTKEEINLGDYLLRNSKNKQRISIALELKEPQGFSKTIRIGCSSLEYDDQLNYISEVWQEAMRDIIQKMLTPTPQNDYSPKKDKKTKSRAYVGISQPIPISDRYVEIGQQQMSEQKNQKEEYVGMEEENQNIRESQLPKIVPDQFLSTLNSFKNFEQVNYGVFYERSSKKVRKIFEFPYPEVTQSLLLAVIDDVAHTRRRKPAVKLVKVIANVPGENTKIFNEIDRFELEDIEFVYYRHFFTRNQCSYLIQKSMDLPGQVTNKKVEKAEIDYCLWRIRSLGTKIELYVEAQIFYGKKIKNSQQITSEYIGDFRDYVASLVKEKKEIIDKSLITDDFENDYLSGIGERKSSQQQDQFFTVVGNMEVGQMVVEAVDHILKQQSHHNLLQMRKESKIDFPFPKMDEETEQLQTKKQSLLGFKHQVDPLPRAAPLYYTSELGHCLWKDDWRINEKGDLLNINEAKIKAQNSVLKLVVKNIGRNLMSGKGIMNTSLPIQIFSTDSNLESMARSYMYAPILLEKANHCLNPIDRMKYCVCFGLTFSISYIGMEKPFNPILGQTFQGVIDGCPVYAEQISHHPPVCSTYFLGRGYKVHGSFQSKVEIGLNSASGINDGFNTIIFDHKKSVFRSNTPPGQMTGVIYGDRKLALVKKSYYIDETHRLFCEIHWGKDKSKIEPLARYHDFFHGTIRKVKSNFNLSNFTKIKPENIEESYGDIYGRFTSKVYYEGEELFDVETALPYKMLNYEPCLISDSRLRKDIQLRRNDDLRAAQIAKEELEEFQRRDKKLRKK